MHSIKNLVVPREVSCEVRMAVVHYLKDKRSDAIGLIRKNLFDAAISEIKICEKLEDFLRESDECFDFEDEEAPF